MAKKKYYWKALRIRKDQFISCIITGKHCLVYPVGKWVEPSIGKIFIFETKRCALNFNEGFVDAYVKKCEAKGVRKPRGDRMGCEVTRMFRSFWRKIFKNGLLPISKEWPDGTLWAEAIKIIE